MKLDCMRPEAPTDNGLTEPFNGRLHDELLNVDEFIAMQHAREKLKAWQHDYPHHRPHGSRGHLTAGELERPIYGYSHGAYPAFFRRCTLRCLRFHVSGPCCSA